MAITEGRVSELSMPPGFRFFPTDEELIVHYLCRKVAGNLFPLEIIGEVDLYKFEPWILPGKACFGEKEWYFFSPRDRKYPNGSRPNRVAGSGYWKATGTDKIIRSEDKKVGIKKALVFYIGKAPKGTKTNWIMHEYRLPESSKKNGSSRLDDWVLCRIYKKLSGNEKINLDTSIQFDDILESLPEIKDESFVLPRMNSLKTLQDGKLNFQNAGPGKFDWNNLGFIESSPELVTNGQIQRPEEVYLTSIQPRYHVDSPSDKFGSSIEDEVDSGIVIDNSGFFRQHPNGNPFIIGNPADPASGSFKFGL